MHILKNAINNIVNSEDFSNIAKLYEEGWGGQLYNDNPNREYSVNQSKHSYRGTLPFNSGGNENNYTSNMMNPSVGIVAGDEEGLELSIKMIKNTDVIDIIDDILAEAESDGMDYCVYALTRLKDKVSSLS